MIDEAISQSTIESIRERLLGWFDGNQRDLPWRRTRDPYHILVSEVMLQQTQVDRVIPYYESWLVSFPSVFALAQASTGDVIKAWAGLGYNRRAVNLQRTARHVASELGGEFPRSVGDLQKLPGIGPYTAGAIACFAFEQDVAFLDTNIRRVMHRLLVGSELPQAKASERELQRLATTLVPQGLGWRWGQAVMEFGALQCTARRPLCVICPLQSQCAAFPTIQSDLAASSRAANGETVPFEQTNRYFRGRVLAALRANSNEHAMSLQEIGEEVKSGFSASDMPWLRGVVDGLARDGLAAIAEEASQYDAPSLRVKLP